MRDNVPRRWPYRTAAQPHRQMRTLASIVGLDSTLSAVLGRSQWLVTVPLRPDRATSEHLATVNGTRRHSPCIEASGRWAALLTRLRGRSRHRRAAGHVQTLPLGGGT